MPALPGHEITPEDYLEITDDLQDQIDDINADLNTGLPRGNIGYAEHVADAISATGGGGEVEIFGSSFNVAANRKVRLTAGGRVFCTTSDDVLVVRVRDDDTGDQLMAMVYTAADANELGSVWKERQLAGEFTGLAEGGHTFRVTIEMLFGDGPAGLKASSEDAWVLSENDDGPSA